MKKNLKKLQLNEWNLCGVSVAFNHIVEWKSRSWLTMIKNTSPALRATDYKCPHIIWFLYDTYTMTLNEKAYNALNDASHKAFAALTQPSDRRFVWLTEAKDIVSDIISESYQKGVEAGRGDAWEQGFKCGVNTMANNVSSVINKAIIESMNNDRT